MIRWDPSGDILKAYAYKPPSFNFNRFCHRLAARQNAEATLPAALGINILRDVLLVDTSTYEGLINVNVLAASDAMGIIPKASQGKRADDQFRNTWNNARGGVCRAVVITSSTRSTVHPSRSMNMCRCSGAIRGTSTGCRLGGHLDRELQRLAVSL